MCARRSSSSRSRASASRVREFTPRERFGGPTAVLALRGRSRSGALPERRLYASRAVASACPADAGAGAGADRSARGAVELARTWRGAEAGRLFGEVPGAGAAPLGENERSDDPWSRESGEPPPRRAFAELSARLFRAAACASCLEASRSRFSCTNRSIICSRVSFDCPEALAVLLWLMLPAADALCVLPRSARMRSRMSLRRSSLVAAEPLPLPPP